MRHHNNASPYGVHVDAETGTSIIFDRLFRPLVSLPGKWPRVDYSAAVACDPEPKLYGIANSYFYRPDDVNAPRCCPIVRHRLAELATSIPALQEEIQRRTKAANLETLTFNFPQTRKRNNPDRVGARPGLIALELARRLVL